MKYLFLLILPILLLADCNFGFKPPVINNTKEICFDMYGVLYSDANRIPMASYEKLTKESVTISTKIPRKDAFHKEPKDPLVSPSDYLNSGYDKGHQCASDDQNSTNAQFQSFSMVNMIAQPASVNRGSWKTLEVLARNNALKGATVFEVSGPLLDGTEKRMKGIVIPTLLYKGISTNGVIVIYVVDNTKNVPPIIYTDDAFTAKYHFEVFPK